MRLFSRSELKHLAEDDKSGWKDVDRFLGWMAEPGINDAIWHSISVHRAGSSGLIILLTVSQWLEAVEWLSCDTINTMIEFCWAGKFKDQQA